MRDGTICYGLPRWLRGRDSLCQSRRCRRCRVNPWVRKIPWRRKQQPTPVFLPEEYHGQRSLAGYHPWNHKESSMIKQLSMHTPSAIGKSLRFTYDRNYCFTNSLTFKDLQSQKIRPIKFFSYIQVLCIYTDLVLVYDYEKLQILLVF